MKSIIIFILLCLIVYNLIYIKFRILDRFNDIKYIGLLTRCKDEKYISTFTEYYLNEGVDHIHIIDDNSKNKKIYEKIINLNNVTIYFEDDIIKKNTANKIYKKIKDSYYWMIYVDVDEYITCKKNKNNTIRDELLTTFKDVDCVKIPWVMMSFNSIKHDPDDLLKTNVYRWNHDKRHDNILNPDKFRCRYDKIEVKCIFKTNKFNSISDHHPKNPTRNVKIVNSINLNVSNLDPFYKNLREECILNGYLLCYHYRLTSIDHCSRKIKENIWYLNNNYSLDNLKSNDFPEIYDDTLKNKIIKNVIVNSKNLFLIHVGKCGGSSINKMLNISEYHLKKPIFSMLHNYIICIRNPIKRFVSAFNMLKDIINFDVTGMSYDYLYNSKDTPLYKLKNKIISKFNNNNNPFASNTFYENLLFFNSANELAESITSNEQVRFQKANQIIYHDEEHIFKGIGWYLDNGDFVEKYFKNILCVIRLENFKDDMIKISKILNKKFDIVHERNSKSRKNYLSSLAIKNIKNFYKYTDYKALEVLKKYNFIDQDTLNSYYKYE